MSASTGANTLVVSDIQRVQDAVEDMLAQLDIETPQVSNIFGRANFETPPRDWELMMVLRRLSRPSVPLF